MMARPAAGPPRRLRLCRPAAATARLLLLLLLLSLAAPCRVATSVRNAGLEAQATSTTSLTEAYGPAGAIDGDNETAWISGVQMKPAFGPRTEEVFELDLSGAYIVQRVQLLWAKSQSEGNLAPSNFSVELSLDGSGFEQMVQLGSSALVDTAVLVPAAASGAAAAAVRFVKIRMWDELEASTYFGLRELTVLAADAPLELVAPRSGAWLSAGESVAISWAPVPLVRQRSCF
eukprot:SAG22_NODE_1030_length_5937_cov_2.536485_4_plen_232_part_00